MDWIIGSALVALGLHWIKLGEQRQRIVLLAKFLSQHPLERHMEHLSQGYLRALGERDPERQQAIWQSLAPVEAAFADHLGRLALRLTEMPAQAARIGRWSLGLPLLTRLSFAPCFDLRQAVALHAAGVARAVQNPDGLTRKDQAYRLMAEMLLFQHTCHWYCRSGLVASARLLARHQTRFDQVLSGVGPETRAAYRELTGR